MTIEEPARQSTGHPLWQLAFRCCFLAAGSWAIIAMIRWLWWLHSPADWNYALSPTWWHAHEMIFGFALPVVAGFLLTAVATWTGLPGTRGWRLQCLFGLWLAARALLWLAPGQLQLALAIELLFMSLVIWELSRRLFAARQWRNAWFPLILLGLAAVDATSHQLAGDPLASTRLFYAMIWLVTTLVVIIGGRVIPLFTSNRLGIKIAPLPGAMEYLAAGITLFIGAIMASPGWQTSGPGFRLLCCLAAVIHLYRLARWQGWRTLQVPLLWSMHISYLCIPLTLLSLALAAGNPIAVKHLVHLLAIATIGGMILTMMSRVALGHTGRTLEVPTYLAVAFAFVIIAGLVRSLLPVAVPQATGAAWNVSALLWSSAFTLFLWRYSPILTKPRVDGKPG